MLKEWYGKYNKRLGVEKRKEEDRDKLSFKEWIDCYWKEKRKDKYY